MKCEENIKTVPPLFPPFFEVVRNSGPCVSEPKTQENDTQFLSSSLLLIKECISKKKLEETNKYIYRERFKKKSGTEELRNQNPDADITSKYPYLESPELADRVKLLLSVYNKLYTVENIDWLIMFYKQARVDLWDYLAGITKISTPSGMVESGVYFAGSSGKAIRPNWFGEQQ